LSSLRFLNGMMWLLLVSTLLMISPTIKPVRALPPTPTQTWSKYLGTGGPVVTPSPSTFDAYGVAFPTVFQDGATYRLYYRAQPGTAQTAWTIGYASSTDRVTFTKDPSNPMLTPTSGGWDKVGLGSPSVLKTRTGEYFMYYGGWDGSSMRIGLATAPAPAGPWTKWPMGGAGAPVLDTTYSAWDAIGVYHPTVLWDERAREYRMWYAGSVDYVHREIGYATSADGKVWQKYFGNPVLKRDPGKWDSYSVDNPSVLKIGGVYWIWYAGTDDFTNVKIGCASSLDGISWTKWGANPLLLPGGAGSWDASGITAPTVFTWGPSDLIFGGALWLGMYYGNGDADKIGHASVAFGMGNVAAFIDAPFWLSYFINGDPSRSAYTAYDSLASGILYGLCYNPQQGGFDTIGGWVEQSAANRGMIKFKGCNVVTMGGRGSNWIVNYYEMTAARTPVWIRVNAAANAYEYVDRASGAVKASMSMSTDFDHHDLAVMMIVPGLLGDSNDILIIYGISWKGTWGAGIYFKDVIYGTGDWSNPFQYVGYNYIILEWYDFDNNGLPIANELSFKAGG